MTEARVNLGVMAWSVLMAVGALVGRPFHRSRLRRLRQARRGHEVRDCVTVMNRALHAVLVERRGRQAHGVGHGHAGPPLVPADAQVKRRLLAVDGQDVCGTHLSIPIEEGIKGFWSWFIVVIDEAVTVFPVMILA
jgi:hypothetical protein